jgi:hypothetical protein
VTQSKRRAAKKTWFLPLSISLLIFAITAEALESVPGRESRYQITSRGFRVGEMKTSSQPLLRDGRRIILFKSTTTIDAKFLFFSKQSKSQDEALVSDTGPIEYHHSKHEDGRVREVAATFTVSQVRLDIREAGMSREITFSRDRYDSTTMDCAEMSLVKEGDRKEIRLLDLENGKIVTRKYFWRKSEDMTISGKTFHCRVVDFEDPDNRCRRWITQDNKGVLIARQEGKGASGSYLLKLAVLDER